MSSKPKLQIDPDVLRVIAAAAGGTIVGGVLGAIILVFMYFGGSGSSSVPSNEVSSNEISSNSLAPNVSNSGIELLSKASLSSGDIKDALALPPLGIDTSKLKQPAIDAIGMSEQYRKVGFAILNFQDKFRTTPNCLKVGENPSGLSWRVHILPFLEQQALYAKFDLNQPWDSPTNRALIEFMPDIYRTSQSKGFNCPFRVPGHLKFNMGNIAIERAMLFAELYGSSDDPWTKPDDIPLNVTTVSSLTSADTIPAVFWSMQRVDLPASIPTDVFNCLTSGTPNVVLDLGTLKRFLAHARGVHHAAEPQWSTWEANQLKSIAMGWLNYESVNRCLPPRVFGTNNLKTANAEINLSWRVHVLPLLGHQSLYDQFKLNEPWNSEHNAKLLKYMPDFYRDATASADSSTTRVLAFSGHGTLFESPHKAFRFNDVVDGISNTIAFVQAPKELETPWTKPGDIPITKLDDLELRFGLKYALLDGAVRTLPPDIDRKILRGLITPSGRELLKDADWRTP